MSWVTLFIQKRRIWILINETCFSLKTLQEGIFCVDFTELPFINGNNQTTNKYVLHNLDKTVHFVLFIEYSNKFIFAMWCSTLKRKIFAGDVNFEFLIWCKELFLSLKITSHLSKLIKAFKFYNWKRIESSYCFLYYFSECFHLYLRKPTAAKSPISMYFISLHSR